ncbi:MAG: hypothetical protein DRP81_09370 [Candidatus Omnitrophota bacterium]|nr:MAG: hypothetical protein DRP81_09370 [Candidatus Omnitrophota bacterium]
MIKKLLIILIITFPLVLFASEEKIRVLEYKNKKIFVEAQGRLTWVKMTNFPDVSWKELALVNKKGEILAILIGNNMQHFWDKGGKVVKVRGLLKPEMWVKGKKTPVIEVKKISYLPFSL